MCGCFCLSEFPFASLGSNTGAEGQNGPLPFGQRQTQWQHMLCNRARKMNGPLLHQLGASHKDPGTRNARAAAFSQNSHAPAQSLQSYPPLRDPMHCSPPVSSVHGDSSGKNTGVGFHANLNIRGLNLPQSSYTFIRTKYIHLFDHC